MKFIPKTSVSLAIGLAVLLAITGCSKPNPPPVASPFRTFGPGSEGADGKPYTGPIGRDGEHCTEMGAGVSPSMKRSLQLAAGRP